MSGNSNPPPVLAYDLDRYFVRTDDAVEVALGRLRPTRRRPEGVQNARKLMALAYDGEHERRAPLSVVADGDGYRILDGNSTYAVAVESGWPALLCRIVA